jgi:sRNA-binding protein
LQELVLWSRVSGFEIENAKEQARPLSAGLFQELREHLSDHRRLYALIAGIRKSKKEAD